MKKITTADIQSFFRSDRAILLLCISIALVFWLLNKLSKSFKTVDQIRIEYRLPTGKTFHHTPPNIVNASIQGRGLELTYIHFFNRERKMVLNLTDQANQVYTSNQLKSAIRELYATNVEVVDMDTNQLVIELEDEATRLIPLKVVAQLNFVSGFYLQKDLQLTPDHIRISGPKSLIDSLPYWTTDTLKLSGLKADVQKKVNVAKPGLAMIKLGTQFVEAKIAVEQFTEKTMFVPILIKNQPAKLKIFPDKIKLSCTVGLSRYNQLNTNFFRAEVDLKGISENTTNNTLPVTLTHQPHFVKNIQFTPKSVEFFFVKE